MESQMKYANYIKYKIQCLGLNFTYTWARMY